MLSGVSVAGIYLSPLFVYACASIPVFLGVRWLFVRSGLLRQVWHPALFEFAVLLALVSLLVLYV